MIVSNMRCNKNSKHVNLNNKLLFSCQPNASPFYFNPYIMSYHVLSGFVQCLPGLLHVGYHVCSSNFQIKLIHCESYIPDILPQHICMFHITHFIKKNVYCSCLYVCLSEYSEARNIPDFNSLRYTYKMYNICIISVHMYMVMYTCENVHHYCGNILNVHTVQLEQNHY